MCIRDRNAIAPGIINTSMNSKFSEEEINNIQEEIPLEKIGEPEEDVISDVFGSLLCQKYALWIKYLLYRILVVWLVRVSVNKFDTLV